MTLPPHPNVQIHQLVMEEIRAMTTDQFIASTVEAGIYMPDGQLTNREILRQKYTGLSIEPKTRMYLER